MTLGELHAGVLMAGDPQVRAARLARFGDVQREFAILDVDPHVAQVFGELRARTGRRAVADLLIAAPHWLTAWCSSRTTSGRRISWATGRSSSPDACGAPLDRVIAP